MKDLNDDFKIIYRRCLMKEYNKGNELLKYHHEKFRINVCNKLSYMFLLGYGNTYPNNVVIYDLPDDIDIKLYKYIQEKYTDILPLNIVQGILGIMDSEYKFIVDKLEVLNKLRELKYEIKI